ncbi:poly [ADP-ribose] polymerase tankyrase-2-like [Micropterus dolomieu]|uniref:poly [ADP-ribose] polymerase tankyrase-2-like n=1 Tax=Micropterus dolomieu TaxID=147949 RepID=UPI001E8D9433|nr:poly [ADP-ribose] polymerase tankyrase-2-like [Micropterus dolomieu]XP_045921095.1 poly [ADP-ribose] polymerase tankyrase-2-like [Micropterus dolomieu]
MNICKKIQEAVSRRKSHPIIQYIINNKLNKLKKALKDNNINAFYPCTEWNDYITPLIAAVVNHNRDIFDFLLEQGADPNIPSQSDLTPLHYVSLYKAPLLFVEKLLEAKASPNGCNLHRFTPVQTAAINDRDDVLKLLISAGALVTLLPLTDPEHIIYNKKISEMIHNLASKGDEICSKIRYFMELEIALQEKPPEEVFKIFDSHMLREHPQTHLTMIEMLFDVIVPDAEIYHQGSVNWVKDNLNPYIASAVCRFPNIPETNVIKAIKSLCAVFQAMEDIPNEQALAIIPELLEQLCSKEKLALYRVVLETLSAITQKTKGTDDWDPIFIKMLCQKVLL